MKLEIVRISDAGDAQRERVVLRAREDCDIGKFALVRAISDESGPFAGSLSHGYWFPDVKVSANDLVVLYSRSGNEKIKKHDSGRTTYFYYQEAEAPLYSKGNHAPVLFSVPEFQTLDIIAGRDEDVDAASS